MNTESAERKLRFERVLVPIDFSDDSLNALQVATDSFARPGATLILVNAVEAAESVAEYAGLHGQVVSTLVSDVQRQIQTLAGTHRQYWQEVQSTVELGKPADVILSAAQTWHADLVVMGSHGKTSLARVLFGGTAYHVARKLACSVMVLRAGKVA
jgi:nucleotide-binding universal stress UspA family protein